MSSHNRFIVKYIADAVKNNLDPTDAAIAEIEEIDEKLHAAEELKIRRMKVLKVLDHFGNDTFRRRRTVSVPASEDVDEDEQLQELQKKILDVLSQYPDRALDMRTIIQKVGSYDKDALVIRAVKNLGDEELVTRDDEKRVMLSPQK